MSLSPYEIGVTELQRWIQSGTALLLLDVRREGGPPLAPDVVSHHIPLHLLPARLTQLPTDCRIVVFCFQGRRAGVAAVYLRELGFDAFSLCGGAAGWEQMDSTDAALYRMENTTTWL